MAEIIEVSMNDDSPPPIASSSEPETAPEGKPNPLRVKPVKPTAKPAPSPAERQSKGEGEGDEGEEHALDEKRSRPDKDKPKISAALQQVKEREDATLRDLVNALGDEGGYRIRVNRLEPVQWRHPTTKQVLNVGGFLQNYTTPVDEEVLAQNHGGGKFQLTFYNRNKQGSYVFFTARTVVIVGDPRIDDTYRHDTVETASPTAPTAPAADSPTLVTKAFDILKDQIGYERTRAADVRPSGPDPSLMAVIDMLKTQIAQQNATIEALRKDLVDARTAKPPEDPFKNFMLENLMKDDSARIQATRAQYESEIRTLKDNHRVELQMVREGFERERSELKQMHMAQLNLVNQTHEMQLATARGMYDTNMKLADHENRRIEKENAELKSDNKELRAKKEKGALELLKEADQLKDALGVGDDGEKSKFDAVLEAAPGLIEAAKTYFKPPQQQQQAGQPQQALQPTRKLFQDAEGNRWMVDDKGNMTPVRKKPKPKPTPQPGPNGEPPIPEIAPETIATMINYLERAFTGNQEPEVVAQSGRAMVPEEIIQAIRDHQVDGFLTKVAKLPSTSPLSNQAGRNWMRKVGAALVGE